MKMKKYPYAVVTPCISWEDAVQTGEVRVISYHRTLINAAKADRKMQNRMPENTWLDQRVWRLAPEGEYYEPLTEDEYLQTMGSL